tara:strand:- start:20 stop:499 length:480 start_codon:yes stop_codon:yes gene_type:complete
MKKLLYTLLAVSIIFSSCEEDDATPSTNNNNTGTITDVVGVWEFEGYYDASDNLIYDFLNIEDENCKMQSNIVLQSDENAIYQLFYLQNEIDGPCINESVVFTFQYINSTTLNFLINTSCGNSFTTTIINNTQLKIPVCTGDDENGGTYDGSYSLWQKQ